MPTMGELSAPDSDPKFCAEPKAATVPLASASQYPVPLLTGAMSTVLDADWTAAATWPQVVVMSLGGEHELTKMAAMEPPAYPVDENAAPMERTGGPVGQLPNWCSMMSR